MFLIYRLKIFIVIGVQNTHTIHSVYVNQSVSFERCLNNTWIGKPREKKLWDLKNSNVSCNDCIQPNQWSLSPTTKHYNIFHNTKINKHFFLVKNNRKTISRSSGIFMFNKYIYWIYQYLNNFYYFCVKNEK